MTESQRRRVIICGAAGRDYHNFNRLYRDNLAFELVAFTENQIPGIAERGVQDVMFAYSDVTHEHVMHMASRVLAAGAGFFFVNPKETQIVAKKPVIAVSAVRTGCGKSQVARYLAPELRKRELRKRELRKKKLLVATLRHPVPYGTLQKQAVQRFEKLEDLDLAVRW